MEWLGAYWIVINVITFCVYGIDKWQAKHRYRRIPEKALLGLAFVGGACGALVGMQLFRHKTQKPKFAMGVPLLLVAQMGVIIWVLVSR